MKLIYITNGSTKMVVMIIPNEVKRSGNMWGNFIPHYKPPTNMITILFTNCVTYKWGERTS